MGARTSGNADAESTGRASGHRQTGMVVPNGTWSTHACAYSGSHAAQRRGARSEGSESESEDTRERAR
eukprot:2770226-Alexandrium_andersonii.AAC.1